MLVQKTLTGLFVQIFYFKNQLSNSMSLCDSILHLNNVISWNRTISMLKKNKLLALFTVHTSKVFKWRLWKPRFCKLLFIDFYYKIYKCFIFLI